MAGVWLSLPPGAPFNTSCVAFVVWFILSSSKAARTLGGKRHQCLAEVEGKEGTAHGQSYKSALNVSERTCMRDCTGSVAQ